MVNIYLRKIFGHLKRTS